MKEAHLRVLNDILLKRYSNGSYAYLDDRDVWKNIPRKLAEILIQKQREIGSK
jgi:hypothetical protein